MTLIADLMADPGTEVEEILRESCGHLARSLDLLSRVLHPSPPGDIGPISVREPLGFIADLHQAGRTGVRLQVTIDPSVRAAAGIERHLEHALLNLVINATDVLRSREGGLIRMTARNVGDGVEVVVADNGPGLQPDRASRLFQYPFTTTADTPATGAGLHVASVVLRLSGATLTYAPDSERGARFVITLPLWRGAANRPES